MVKGEDMRQSQISVVVPVYNTAKYLEQCICSIMNQTFKDLEIILVDDGSTDNSWEILKRFERRDTRITVIHREKSSGSAAMPRNIGLGCATSKYIIFLDSDDYFDLNMFEKMYYYAEKNQADLVICDNYYVSPVSGVIKNRSGELCHKYLDDKKVFSYKDMPDTIFQISNSVWNKLILRDTLTINRLEFQENTRSLDDLYFANLLLLFSKRIYVLNEKLVFYRQFRPGSQTTAVAKNKESIFFAFDKLNKYLIRNHLYDKIKKSLQNWTLDTLAWWYYLAREFKAEQELFFLYKKYYFKELKLLDMDETDIYNNQSFYHYILYGEYRPSVSVILNSVSSKGIRVIIYGAGVLGKNVYQYIVENEPLHTIKLWCDKNADKMENPLIQRPEKIRNVEYDAIIIAIGNDKIVFEVNNYLEKMGVDQKKIYCL